MPTSKIPCRYSKTTDAKIKGLSELKEQYCFSQSSFIKSLLRQTEDLILFRVGNKTMILDRVKAVINPTQEERCFIAKLKKFLADWQKYRVNIVHSVFLYESKYPIYITYSL